MDGRILRVEKFLIAAGSSPHIIPLKGIDKVDYLTNVEAMELSELPGSMIVLGGRALGLEFAQMFSHFGTKVTVLQRSPRIIPEEESIISDYLKTYLEEEDINIQTNVGLKSVKKEKIISSSAHRLEGKKGNLKLKNCLFPQAGGPILRI